MESLRLLRSLEPQEILGPLPLWLLVPFELLAYLKPLWPLEPLEPLEFLWLLEFMGSLGPLEPLEPLESLNSIEPLGPLESPEPLGAPGAPGNLGDPKVIGFTGTHGFIGFPRAPGLQAPLGPQGGKSYRGSRSSRGPYPRWVPGSGEPVIQGLLGLHGRATVSPGAPT